MPLLLKPSFPFRLGVFLASTRIVLETLQSSDLATWLDGHFFRRSSKIAWFPPETLCIFWTASFRRTARSRFPCIRSSLQNSCNPQDSCRLLRTLSTQAILPPPCIQWLCDHFPNIGKSFSSWYSTKSYLHSSYLSWPIRFFLVGDNSELHSSPVGS